MSWTPLVGGLVAALLGSGGPQDPADLPVRIPDLPEARASIRNPLSFEELTVIEGPSEDGRGLVLVLPDESWQGTIYSGPYPFEYGLSDFDHTVYRASHPLKDGRGVIEVKRFLESRYNANDWPEGQAGSFSPSMTVAYRIALGRVDDSEGVRDYGFYDSRVSFRLDEAGGFVKIPTLTEGPLVGMLRSDDPSRLVIAFETDTLARGAVQLFPDGLPGAAEPAAVFEGPEATRHHELTVEGLEADRDYAYRVVAEDELGERVASGLYTFHTAPEKGSSGPTRFAFLSDSRQGLGGGERAHAGHNRHSLCPLAVSAYRQGASFCLVGGDLVNGDTSSPGDFRLQLRAWKQTFEGFSRSRPVYPAMGNHERLVNAYKEGLTTVWLDKWPYATDSAEAIFAEQFLNPINGPNPSDARRPSYRENVYHFQYGPTLVVAYNNNYWWSSDRQVPHYGGAPEGYIFADQLEWIEQVLAQAEQDESIQFIVLYAQEPVFPCGGHMGDAMWWRGDNRMRAFTHVEGELIPAPEGMIEVRNRLWAAISKSSKVAVVLAGDEHAYHRLRIDAATPVGLFPEDDTDGDGVLDRYSPNPDFIHPTWQVVAGTGGAPYYNRQPSPWEPIVYDSQTGYCLFETDGDRISLTFHTITGQVTDRVEDLMAIKRR